MIMDNSLAFDINFKAFRLNKLGDLMATQNHE